MTRQLFSVGHVLSEAEIGVFRLYIINCEEIQLQAGLHPEFLINIHLMSPLSADTHVLPNYRKTE